MAAARALLPAAASASSHDALARRRASGRSAGVSHCPAFARAAAAAPRRRWRASRADRAGGLRWPAAATADDAVGGAVAEVDDDPIRYYSGEEEQQDVPREGEAGALALADEGLGGGDGDGGALDKTALQSFLYPGTPTL